jgi:VanZ family protein
VKRALLAFLPLGLWAAAVLTLGALDFRDTPLPALPPGTDKVVHFIMYGIGGALAAWGGRKAESRRAAWLGLGLVILTGIADELHQGTVPGRHSDIMDVAADAAGALFLFVVADRLLKRK